MKVVLFCGGLGRRLRDYSESIPKPMVPIGYRPILWHLMKYYAHFGHKDFILCLGYRGDAIKEYFLNFNECVSNDFVLSSGGAKLELLNRDIQDWTITFAETGANSNIGQRLRAIERYVKDEPVFLANYSDGLTDLHFPTYLDCAMKQNKVASFVSVKPNLSYHLVQSEPGGLVSEITPITQTNVRVNGGYFVFKQDIFHYLKNGEELVLEPFQRLIAEKQLAVYEHDGFFACMDTFKDKQQLDDVYSQGDAPWEVWKDDAKDAAKHAATESPSAPHAGKPDSVRMPAGRHA
ncbi:MAG: sugar phosphate nucleotidyltransferase [Candidatus Acidiferrales bacterium]